MQLIEFVKKHLGEYKVKGKELIIKKCPYCGKEKNKFYINTEKGLYQCFSGSCRATGHIHSLYGKFNVSMPDMRFKSKNLDLKTYVKVLSEDCIKFLNDRGISKKVIDNNIFDIASTSDNKISFIYRKHFEVHSIKVRDIKEKSFLGKKLKELTLWKLDFADKELPLIICEGEIDQLSFEEQDIKNSVSVPAGASSLGWIDTDYEDLEKFKTIILAFDSDKAGKEAVKKIIKRLPEESEIKIIDFLDSKDANEVLKTGGNIQDYIDNAQSIDDDYVVKMSEVDNTKKIERYSTGILQFNRAVGGIRMGEVSIWTGQAGSGKSTVLNQVLLNVMAQDVKCCIYTPELTDRQYKDWTTRQLLNDVKGNFEKDYCNIREKDIYTVKEETAIKMSEWVDKYLINITARKNLTDKEILKIIIKRIKKDDIKFLVIDNLMKIIFDDDRGELAIQKDILNKLSEISKKYNVNINLVAHPKKHDKTCPDQYDIAGSSNIPNLVDNIYYFRRVTDWCLDNDLKKEKDKMISQNISTLMMVLKSREGEKIGTWNNYCFDINRKSIYNYEEGMKLISNWVNSEETKDDLDIF